jgi:Arc/MetJ-type ribon-helix-helix transcriptional regulator
MAKEYTRKKPIISGTVSPIYKKKIDRLVEAGEYASVSDFINQAVSDLLKKYEDSMPAAESNIFTEDEIELIRSIIREKSAEMNFDKGKKRN